MKCRECNVRWDPNIPESMHCPGCGKDNAREVIALLQEEVRWLRKKYAEEVEICTAYSKDNQKLRKMQQFLKDFREKLNDLDGAMSTEKS